MKDTQITLRVDRDLATSFSLVAKSTGQTVSDALREAMAAYVVTFRRRSSSSESAKEPVGTSSLAKSSDAAEAIGET